MKLFPNQKMANATQHSIEAKNFYLLCSRELLIVYCPTFCSGFKSKPSHTCCFWVHSVLLTKKKLNTEAMQKAHP